MVVVESVKGDWILSISRMSDNRTISEWIWSVRERVVEMIQDFGVDQLERWTCCEL